MELQSLKFGTNGIYVIEKKEEDLCRYNFIAASGHRPSCDVYK